MSLRQSPIVEQTERVFQFAFAPFAYAYERMVFDEHEGFAPYLHSVENAPFLNIEDVGTARAFESQ